MLLRSDYSLPSALLGLSLLFGYYGGYVPHHSVMYGILFTVLGLVAGVVEVAMLVLTAWLIGKAIRTTVRWAKRGYRRDSEA
jgi:hypothetical protein